MAEWLEDHVAAIASFKLKPWSLWLMSDKMETRRGQLGGRVEHSEINGGESVVVILRFLCGSPHLCQLRTEGLVPVSKYWTYRSHAGDIDPVSLVACCRYMLGFAPTTSRLDRARNWVRTRGPVSRRVVDCVRSPFSGAVALLNSVDDSWKVATYGDYPQKAYTGCTWTDMKIIHVVLIGFSPTGCTSIRIAASLGYK
jgi:hypothetical protein